MPKKFIIFVDILGFQELPERLVDGTQFDKDIIRERLLSQPLRKSIRDFMDKYLIPEENLIEGTDDYTLLIDDDLDKLFILLHYLIHIEIGHKGYEFIPVEIAVGYQDFDLKVKDFINDSKIISYLKNDIIYPYRKQYEGENGKKIDDTFIVITDDVYKELNGSLNENCVLYHSEIGLNIKKREISYYNVPKKTIKIEGEKRLQERRPRLAIMGYIIEKEYEKTPHSFHLRFPVIAKNGDCNRTQAKILSLTRIANDCDTALEYIKGSKILFWARQWKDHDHPIVDITPQYIENHLRAYHFCSAAPIDIRRETEELVNVLVTIQDKEGWFLGNDLFEHKEKGDFEIIIEFSSFNVEPCIKTIRVHIGDSHNDVKVISCS